MKIFADFILEASSGCNNTSVGINCPVHGNKKCPTIKSHKTPEEIAKKHRLDASFIKKQLKTGISIEREHTKNTILATYIALQHLDEIPDYYTRLKKMETSAKKDHKKFKDIRENSVKELEKGLKNIDSTSYDSIDNLMRNIMKKHNISARELHNNFTKKHNKTPDTWAKNIKKQKNKLEEKYVRIQSRGTTYTIVLNWRGKNIVSQMFLSQFNRPSKIQITDEIRKIYPNATILSFYPSMRDPTQPLIFSGENQ